MTEAWAFGSRAYLAYRVVHIRLNIGIRHQSCDYHCGDSSPFPTRCSDRQAKAGPTCTQTRRAPLRPAPIHSAIDTRPGLTCAAFRNSGQAHANRMAFGMHKKSSYNGNVLYSGTCGNLIGAYLDNHSKNLGLCSCKMQYDRGSLRLTQCSGLFRLVQALGGLYAFHKLSMKPR